MEGLLPGIIVFIAALAFGLLSWYCCFRQEKTSLGLFLLLVLGLLLRLYLGADQFLHPWDERYHALVAKNLLSHPLVPTLYENPVLPYDFRHWASNHIWVHKQPLPLWLLAGGIWLFGDSELGLRLPSIILSTIAILLTFQIGKILFNRKVAYWAAFLHAINGLLIELAAGRVATDHIDTSFQFVVELGVFFAVLAVYRNRNWLIPFIGLAMGAAVLSKWLPALIILPVWAAFRYDVHKRIDWRLIGEGALILFAAGIVAIPWQVYIHQAFPLEAAWESSYNRKHLFEGLEGHGQPFYFHLVKIMRIYGELVYLPLIYLLYRAIKERYNFKLWALAAWIFIPLVFFSLAKTKMQAYTVLSAPALFLSIALLLKDLLTGHFPVSLPSWSRWLAAVLLIVLPIRYSIERCKFFVDTDREPAWAKHAKSLCEYEKPGKETLVFNTAHPIETMFYCDRLTAYETLPEPELIQALLGEGYLIVIDNTSGRKSKYQADGYEDSLIFIE